jgi:hypothetical protein
MSKPSDSNNKTVFDTDYDNDTWTEKEVSLSSKVLVAIGGITSLGGMIPLLITKLSQAFNGFEVGPWFFIIFTIVYFAGPLALLIGWSHFTNRIIHPTEKITKPWNGFASWRRDFKMSPVTYRYKWIIWIHIFCIVVYLIIAIYFPNAYLLLCLSVILLIAPVMALWTFTNRVYKPKKLRLGVIKIISGVMLVIAGVAISCVYKKDISKNLAEGENKLENDDYEKIAYVEEASDKLAHIENDLVNVADRFFIISGMNAWNVISQEMTYFEDSVDLSAFKIDSSIASLNNYVIDDDAASLPLKKDLYIINALAYNDSIKKTEYKIREEKRKEQAQDKKNQKLNRNNIADKSNSLKFFIPHNPFCKHHYSAIRNPSSIDTANKTATLGEYYNQIFIAPNNDTATLQLVLANRKNQILNEFINLKTEELSTSKDLDTASMDSIKEVIESSNQIKKKDIKSLTKKELLFVASISGDKIDFKMGMVNGHLDEMLENGTHRLYPDCFSHFIIFPQSDSLQKDVKCKKIYSVDWVNHKNTPYNVGFSSESLPSDQLDSCFCLNLEKTLNQRYSSSYDYDKLFINDSLILYAIRLNDDLKEKLAVTMNRRNSRVLKDWLEGMYLPYAQRKTGQEIQRIGEETEWIWKEIKYMGIILSITTLFLLSLQYLELNDLKNHIINKKILSGTSDKETQKTKIAELNQKANFLLFPLTTTLTIVAVLLIPVTTKTELVNIEPTKSFRMLQVPSLNLPQAVSSAVNIKDKEEGDNDIKQLRDEINKLSQEINALKQSIDNLKLKKDSLSSTFVLTKVEESQKNQTKELTDRIGELEERLNQKIATVQKAVDKTKRR